MFNQGCVKTLSSNVDVHGHPDEDSEYSDVLEKATKEATVIKDFETRYKVSATFLSPEFRSAFTKRLESVYLQGALKFDEARSKAGFFVILYTPDDERVNLANPQHWTVLLETAEGQLKPVLVKRLTDKERWRAFFDGVNDWTREYLVVFDTPSVNPNSPELVEKPQIHLIFANADGKVKLNW
jgi:hypothetical protein